MYVERSAEGKIIGLRKEPSPNSTEVKSLSDQEVVDFLEQNLENDKLKLLLSRTDMSFIRLLEDLIDLLMKKNIVILTEFPEKAQEKLISRKRIREKISSQNLVVEDIL